MRKKVIRIAGSRKPKKEFRYEKTNIEWADFTLNLWWGCTKVSDGCDNCYAEKGAKFRFKKYPIWGLGTPRRKISGSFDKLKNLQDEAAAKRVIYRVFVGSMMDIFEKSMDLIDNKGKRLQQTTGELRDKLFTNISGGKYENLMFMFLTKRPSNINKMIPDEWKINPPVNVFFGTSPVSKATAFNFIEHLLKVKGKKFLSVEPLLERISLWPWLKDNLIDFVIVGGESGGERRPFDSEWGRVIMDECAASNTPFFMKQIDKVKSIPYELRIRQRPGAVYGCAATNCGAVNDVSYQALNPKPKK